MLLLRRLLLRVGSRRRSFLVRVALIGLLNLIVDRRLLICRRGLVFLLLQLLDLRGVIGLALPGYAVYGASKAAVETMTNIFAKELRGKNINVNAIAPGPTATALFLTGKTEDMINRMSQAAPLERRGTPDDIAAAVSFLAGPDASWINGQTLRANGGLV